MAQHPAALQWFWLWGLLWVAEEQVWRFIQQLLLIKCELCAGPRAGAVESGGTVPPSRALWPQSHKVRLEGDKQETMTGLMDSGCHEQPSSGQREM